MDLIKLVLETIEGHKSRHAFNTVLFNILEGDVYSYICKSIEDQMSPLSAKTAKFRIPPINVLRKVVCKLTKLYGRPVVRSTDEQSDMDLIAYYEKEIGVNKLFDSLNFNFNGYKYAAMKIFEDENGISARPLTATQFIPISTSGDPTKIDVIIEPAGMVGNNKKFWVYTASTFTSILENGSIFEEDMKENEGLNPYGVLPFAYANSSSYLTIPKEDHDMALMPILIPLLMTEINFGMQFLANPIIYGINLNLENIRISPNAVLNLKTDDVAAGQTQSIDVLQPSMDIQNQSKWIAQDLMATWLESKDIRASVVGSTDNAVSGINLMIREMDTTENVKRQSVIFKDVESDFWHKLATIHNYAVDAGRIDAGKFSDNLNLTVQYADPEPIQDRITIVDTVQKEMDAGLLSKRSALKRLNPGMTDQEIDKELELISKEKETKITMVGFNGLPESNSTDNAEGSVGESSGLPNE